MEKIATATAIYGRDLFSYEMWGGATFDVAYRFLKEDPWERLDMLRQKMPNTLTQMLIRGANAVGYKNYPDNVIRRFIKEAAKSIDIFRIFDSLNWIEGMTVSLSCPLGIRNGWEKKLLTNSLKNSFSVWESQMMFLPCAHSC